MLWIAFRIQYLWYQQQQVQRLQYMPDSCELLSEFSIFDTNNNFVVFNRDNFVVVNCFQNSVSLIPTTTGNVLKRRWRQLWIAFRIQYLWYQQQPVSLKRQRYLRCELLSEFSIFDTNNNKLILLLKQQLVVNCFQNSVSLIPTTTQTANDRVSELLWIAFRIQYLWYQQQQINKRD